MNFKQAIVFEYLFMGDTDAVTRDFWVCYSTINGHWQAPSEYVCIGRTRLATKLGV